MLHSIFFTLPVSPRFRSVGQALVCPTSNALRQWLHFLLLRLRPLRLRPLQLRPLRLQLRPTAPPPLPPLLLQLRPTAPPPPPPLPRLAQPQRLLRPLQPPRPLQRPRPPLLTALWRGRGAPLL